MTLKIRLAVPADAAVVASLAMALTDEIVERTGMPHFNADLAGSTTLARRLLSEGKYTALLGFPEEGTEAVALATLCEAHSLYAEGSFGILQEFFVAPPYRSQQVGEKMLRQVVDQARLMGWRRLELCTPPLPEFERTLRFYEDNDFEITGGRKMKFVLERT